MKGIAHFLTGVALATCFPRVLELARDGSLLPVLGGVGGLLPDLLDFRFVRYFEHYDLEISPGPVSDEDASAAAAEIADALAAAMHRAYTNHNSCNVMAHTIRMGTNLWRRYTLRIEPESGTIAVRFGPLVTTSQVAYPGTELPNADWAVRDVGFPFVHTYSREYHIDIFSGPSFRFEREGDRLHIHFLDWHHRWTHSLPLAVALGGLVGVLSGLVWGVTTGVRAALITGVAAGAHVLEDQLGHMGSNLWWPFTRKRVPGLGLLHAGEAIPNFLTVWTALALIFYNLDRFGGPGYLKPLPYFVLIVGLPWLVLGGWRFLKRRRAEQLAAAAWVDAERLAESREIEIG
ncbi:MAG: metal-dependent hydrolase [Anaerolineae bacterium]